MGKRKPPLQVKEPVLVFDDERDLALERLKQCAREAKEQRELICSLAEEQREHCLVSLQHSEKARSEALEMQLESQRLLNWLQHLPSSQSES